MNPDPYPENLAGAGRNAMSDVSSGRRRDGNDEVAAPVAWWLAGRVMHARLRPARHRFVYPLYGMTVNLSRVHTLASWWFGVDRWAPFSLRWRDYGACDGTPPEPWVRRQLADAGIPADGDIWLQTLPRVFGYAFNPVSFWFCHDRAGQLRALLAEVRNTFGARHRYLLSAPGHMPIDAHTRLTCRKVLHVSPFCNVEGGYTFRVVDDNAHTTVGIDYHDRDGLLIRTAVYGAKTPFTAASAFAALLRQPLMALAVVVRIHWQALRLLRKQVPFYGKHPANAGASTARARRAPRYPGSVATMDRADANDQDEVH